MLVVMAYIKNLHQLKYHVLYISFDIKELFLLQMYIQRRQWSLRNLSFLLKQSYALVSRSRRSGNKSQHFVTYVNTNSSKRS